MRSKQYFTSIKNNPHEISTDPVIGLWLGMQLVEKYMKQHSDVSIATLLERTDFGNLTLD